MSIPSDNPILLARDLGPGEEAPVFSLAVGDGEIVALTGTAPDVESSIPLLRRLAGAEASAEGTLWIKGESLHRLRAAARLRFSHTQCAVLPRVSRLLPELSVVENTALPLLLTGLGRYEARRRALRWLERLDVAACADWRIAELSPGELRRVSIARALVTDPVILLAEEPLDGLGLAERVHLLRILRAAAGTHRLTVVIATADEDVARWADRRVALPGTPVVEQVAGQAAESPTAAVEDPAEPDDADGSEGPPVETTSPAGRVSSGMTNHPLRIRSRQNSKGRHRAPEPVEIGTGASGKAGGR